MDALEGQSASPSGKAEFAEAAKAEPKAKKSVSLWQVCCVVVVVSIISSVTSIAVYDRYYAQKIAVLDTADFLKRQKALFLAKKISGDELLKSDEIIYDFIDSIGPNYVLLRKDAVIKNGIYVTP